MEDIARFYDEDAHVEWERLDRHRTEFAVTMLALGEYLPPVPANILDVGCGPGRYAVALAESGHTVTIADIAQESVQRAAAHAQAAGVTLAGVHHASATNLSALSDATFDAVLMLGPLYHLIESEDHRAAIQEARRVLRPGGLIFAAFLNCFSALRVCAERFPEWLAHNPDYAVRLLETGIHRGEWGFTTAYHVYPDQIAPLMQENGFEQLEIVGCEGIIVNHAEQSVNALSGEDWAWWAEFNYRLGKDPMLHGSATHLLYVGRRN